MAGTSAVTKGAARKVKSGLNRRKTKYPRQAARTEKHKRDQPKARARWLAKRQDRAKLTLGQCKGEGFARNLSMKADAQTTGMTIKEYKKQFPNWRETHSLKKVVA